MQKDPAQEAVRTIQERYRSFRKRRELAGLALSKSDWGPLLNQVDTVLRTSQSEEAQPEQLSVRGKWLRGVGCAGAIGRGSADGVGDGLLLRKEHWLEVVDVKHRYGSNLTPYHEHWLQSPSTQSFFFWLDHGEGKDLNLPNACRKQLDGQRLRYCTKEERKKFAVQIGDDHLLRFQHNQVLVHTLSSDEEQQIDQDFASWKDAETKALALGRGPKPDKDTMSEAELQERKTAKKRRNTNKWIYVTSADRKQLYIAPKVKGEFQHSSFLSGGSVGSAGAVMVNQGRIIKLAPMSGHYQPNIEQFIAFLNQLTEQGVDVSNALLLNPFPVEVDCKHHLVQVDLESLDDHK